MPDLGSIDKVDVKNWWSGFEINGKFTSGKLCFVFIPKATTDP